MSKKEFIFISYSSSDAHTAQEVFNYLTDRNLSCWMAPQSLRAGEDYPSQIIEAIRDCSAFILLASHNTNKSAHVSNEVASAFDAGKPLVAVRLENVEFTDEYIYFLKRKHWIDAYSDMAKSLEQLYFTLKNFIEAESTPAQGGEFYRDNLHIIESASAIDKIKSKTIEKTEKKKITDRREIATILKRMTTKYSYTLYERIDTTVKYDKFVKNAEILFANTMHLESHGTVIKEIEGYVEFAVKNLSENNNAVIHVLGMPGSAKNMLQQLVFFKMMDNFVNGISNILPIYVSAGYYERYPYRAGNEQEEMTNLIKKIWSHILIMFAEMKVLLLLYSLMGLGNI